MVARTCRQQRPEMDIESLDAIHESSLRSNDGRVVAVVELFGGVGETSYLIAKLHGLKAGVNFDICCGFNRSLARDRELVNSYIATRKPLVAVMAGQLQHLNEVIFPETWHRTRDGCCFSTVLCRNSEHAACSWSPFCGRTASRQYLHIGISTPDPCNHKPRPDANSAKAD